MQEVTIAIPDEAYATAQNRARLEGFGSTEIFLSDLIVNTITDDLANYDHLFTPEVIAAIDAAAVEARAGNNLTVEQVNEQLKAKRKKWLANHPA